LSAPIPIYLAVEDDLSEWILRRLLSTRSVKYAIGPVFNKGGFGYLKKQTPAFNNMAKACPILMLTDLDQRPCAPGLISDWLSQPKQCDFLLRVAVREVESWLLASDSELRTFLGVRSNVNFPDPETLIDPKLELLQLASKSPRRELREAIFRRDGGGGLKQGPAYNSELSRFIDGSWSHDTAALKCPSLRGLLASLSELESRWRK
jgi:hypothetical protein